MTRETAQVEVIDAETGEIAQNRGRSLANLRPFQPGQSGNPGGRPRAVAEVVELARAHTVTAMQTLVEIATNKKASSPARVAAADAILDRGWGKAAQVVELGATGSFDEWLKARAEAMRNER
jgi:hypothetical protein